MLRLVLGSSPDEKLNMYSQEMGRLLSEEKSVCCIVPDQFSFEFDKILYDELGAKDFNRVSVVSFKKLSEELVTGLGTDAGTLIRPEERTALIYLALKKVRADGGLRLLSRAASKPSFISEISEMMDSLIRSGTSADDLKSCSERLSGSLKDKLYDVSLIYEAYLSQLSQRGLRDESSMISIGALLADKSGYFKDKYVYVDRFESYSCDELKLLSVAVKDARLVSVSLTLPYNMVPGPVSPYRATYSTQERLTRLAMENNKSIEFVSCPAAASTPKGLTDFIACMEGRPTSEAVDDGSVRVYSAPTVYEEADLAAAEIRRLVSSGEYAYNDIALVTRDISGYQTAIESSFERYDLPLFLDIRQKASDMSCVLYAFAAIDAASTREPDTDRLLKLIRSPFSSFTDEEISLIEDYCLRWNVDGKMWLEDFVASEDDDIAALNELRKRIILPIKTLHDDCKGSSAEGIALAFNRYIESCGLAEQACNIINDCTDPADKLENARLFKQLWNVLMNCVSAAYRTLGNEKLTLREFGDILKLMLSGTYISSPPQKLSDVSVYDAARSVIAFKKVVFVLGVNDSKFPLSEKKTGIFSGKDSAVLEREGLIFEQGELERLESERFDCFRALACAGERLYILYSDSDSSGKSLRPSSFVKRSFSALGLKTVKADSLPLEFYCSTPQAAYYRLSVERKGTQNELLSVKAALEELPEYKIKLDGAAKSARASVRQLSPHISKRLFAPESINITASRIDVYNKCNFEYFLKHGLELKNVTPMAIDPANRGNIMHYVFENVLKTFGADYENASDEDIEKLVSELLEGYVKDRLGGSFGKTSKFSADYARVKSACLEILFNIREEYRVSKFRPVRFEYQLSSENGKSVLSIPISAGVDINLRGIVDRIDTYTDPNGVKYIRITDYKTGKKELDLEDVYNGLNLQMLLYMLALTEGTDPDFNDCTPAGILYMRAGFLACADEEAGENEDGTQRDRRRAKQLVRSGLIVEDDESINAMDDSVSGTYVPVRIKKDGTYTAASSIISPESFKLLEEFAKRKVCEFGQSLLIGKIDPVPCGRNEKSLPCTYCDYYSVCDRKKYKYKLIDRSDKDKLLSEIEAKED